VERPAVAPSATVGNETARLVPPPVLPDPPAALNEPPTERKPKPKTERRVRVELEPPTVPPEPPRVPRGEFGAERNGEDGGRDDQPKNPDAAELFVNVGRKDGAKASDFYSILEAKSGISIDDTDYVNVRQRHTFIGLRKELLDRALDALNGAMIAGREAAAEPSRSRP
jgi:ATP-dependent RNA helicase DeaD